MIDPVALEHVRRALGERLRMLPTVGDARQRIARMRALLEEVGVRCDEHADLTDLDAVLFASARGTEALIAARLDDGQRLMAYARLLARLLLGDLRPPIDAKMEYADERSAPSRRDRDEERTVLDLAHAIAEGRLDTAPRPLYEDVPKLTLAFTPRSAARSTLGGFHLWSGYWYRRSNMYRRWRSRRDVSEAIRQICVVLGRVAVPAA
jgi:hypothetical protein